MEKMRKRILVEARLGIVVTVAAAGWLSTLLPLAAQTCGNGTIQSPTSPGSDNDNPTSNTPDPVTAYTGNEHRTSSDLVVNGGVGQHTLAWMRYGHSRTTSGASWFGLGHNWRHAYQWEMVDMSAGNVVINCPDGTTLTYHNYTGTLWRNYYPNGTYADTLKQQNNDFYLQRQNGYIYHFVRVVPASGGQYYLMTDFTDSQGNKYPFTYNTANQLVRVTEPAGRSLQIAYKSVSYTDVSGASLSKTVIDHVSSSDSRTETYNYANFTSGQSTQQYPVLSSVSYDDGQQASYAYAQVYANTQPLATGFVEPRYISGPLSSSRTDYYTNSANIVGAVSNQKTIAGQIVSSISSIGVHQPTIYDPRTNTKQVITMWGGNATVSSKKDALGNQTAYAYNSNGLLAKKTDAKGAVVSMTNSGYGNLQNLTNADGSVKSWTRDSLDLPLSITNELGNKTSISRDSLSHVIHIVYPSRDGHDEEYYTYTRFGNVASHTLRSGYTETSLYDSTGRKTSHTDPAGKVTQYTYDAYERVASITDPRGNATSYNYDLRGHVTQVIHPDGTTASATYDTFGNQLTATDEVRNTTSYSYDSLNRMASMTNGLGQVTQYTYSQNSYFQRPLKVTSPSGKVMTMDYDANGRMTSFTTGFGTGVAATTSYVYDAVGNLASYTDPLGKVWSYAHDLRGRLTSMADPLGNTTSYTYDVVGNLLTTTRPDGGVVTNQYDSMNRLTQSTDPKGQVTKMSYDASGNVLTVTDPKNNVYSYTYDALSRRTAMVYPGGSHEDYAYDSVGNLATYTNRAGQVCTLSYDVNNRNTGLAWSGGSAPSITKTYDAAGRLLTINNGVSTLSYAYDAANRVLSETQATTGAPGGGHIVSYTYNADGSRIAVTYPVSGSTVSYTRDARNRIQTIALDGAPPLGAYTYDANGNRTSRTLSNGTSTSYAYDAANRLTSLIHASGTGVFASFNYGLNNLGLRTYVKHADGTGDVFGYDATDQVTSVQYGATNPDTAPTGASRTVSYTYDASGNRTQVTDNGATTPYSANSLNQYSTLGYDAQGNVITGAGWAYTYDAQNRLIGASNGSTSVSMSYDALNRCISRTTNGATTYFFYDGWSLIEEMDSAGVQQAKYVNGANTDEPLCLINALGTHYYHQDGHNNVINLTNMGGAVEESYHYDVFGTWNIQDGTGNGLSVSALGNRFAYTGREYVNELGLYDYRNRVYSPQLGSFFQTDPTGFGGEDMNLYRYAGNQVVNGSDPQGLYVTYDGGGSSADWNKWSDNFAKDYATPEGKKKWDKKYACPDEHKQYADGHEDGPKKPDDDGWLKKLEKWYDQNLWPSPFQNMQLSPNGGMPYEPRVRERGLEDPTSHNFPHSFDEGILATKPIPQGNGYNFFRKPGSMNGKEGVFEIGVTKDGVIDHRFFRPY